MNAHNCLVWVKEYGTAELRDLRTSLHVVEWVADRAKLACSDPGEEALCDFVKAFHREQVDLLRKG